MQETWLKERLAESQKDSKPSGVDFEDRDMQTVMETLFDIHAKLIRVLDLLEDDDGEEEEEEDS
jgi:hypothetical protein